MTGAFDLRRRRQVIASLLGLVTIGARAQTWLPRGRTVRLTVAYPPGGVSDETARDLATGLETRLGVPVLVDHRPGAGGAAAMEVLSRTRADGLSLCFSAITPLLRLPHLGPLRYDPEHDIAPVAAVMSTPVLVVATPAFQGSTFADVVAGARREPGRLRWATSGYATTGHWVLEQIRALAVLDITHIPYTGGGQQINDALAGHFELLSSNVAARQLALVRAGRLRALAVGAPQRLAVLPDVPTFAELGYEAANLSSLFGVFAPGTTPAALLDTWNMHINTVLDQAEFKHRLVANGNVPMRTSRSEFAHRIATEAAALLRQLGGMSAVQK